MIIRLPRDFLFPLAIFAFIGLTVRYVDIVFTPSTRWIFLALLILSLLIKNRLLFGLRSPFGVAVFVYCAWCILTSMWSEVPALSIAKSIAFALVALSFVSAGHCWVRERGSLNALNYLAPVTAVALFAALAGGVSVAGGGGAQNLEFYEGLTGNSNMLGSLICMALPLLLWNAYTHRTNPKAKWIWIALLAVAAAFLLRSYSRSSILATGMIGIGFFLSLKTRTTTFLLLLVAGALLIAAAIGTVFLDTTYHEYVLKGGSEAEGITSSRRDVWQKSYENAVEGGWFGAGYGVTVGDTSFQGGLTAVGYGREKGNAQLAIVEETGVVGLGLYLILLLTLFRRLVSVFIREKTDDIKVAMGIVIGGLAGFTLMAAFEAWWVAPGSPESAFFWSLAGVALSLAEKSVGAPMSFRESGIAQSQPLYPARIPPQRSVKG